MVKSMFNHKNIIKMKKSIQKQRLNIQKQHNLKNKKRKMILSIKIA